MADKQEHKWVVMVYLAGDNNLADEMVWSLKSMADAGNSPNFYAFARYVSREQHIPVMDFNFRGMNRNVASRGWQAYSKDRPGKITRPKIADDLKSFVSNSIETVKKEHKSDDPPLRFMLVLAGHSGGVHGELLPAENSGDSLSICQLGAVVRHSRDEIRQLAKDLPGRVRKNRELDILAMDSCLMSMAEVCYEIENGSPAVRYLIGSEGLEMNTGWPYQRILEILQQKKGPSTLGFVRDIVDAYHDYYADYVLAGQSVDLSACALTRGRLGTFSNGLNELSRSLLQAVEGRNKRILDAILLSHWRAQSYRYEQYVDLYDLCELLGEDLEEDPGEDNESVQKVIDACQAVRNAIRSRQKSLVVAGSHRGPAFQHSHGVSIYFPWYGSEPDLKHYQTLALPNETGWLDFLGAFLKATRREPRSGPGRLRAAFQLDPSQQFRSGPEHTPRSGSEHDPRISSMLASTMKNPPAYFRAEDKELGNHLVVRNPYRRPRKPRSKPPKPRPVGQRLAKTA